MVKCIIIYLNKWQWSFSVKKTTLSLNKLAEPLWYGDLPVSIATSLIYYIDLWFSLDSSYLDHPLPCLILSVRIFSKDFVQWRRSLLHATAYQGCLWSSVRPFTQTLHSNVNMIPKTRGLNSYELFTSIDYHLCAGLRRHALLFN